MAKKEKKTTAADKGSPPAAAGSKEKRQWYKKNGTKNGRKQSDRSEDLPLGVTVGGHGSLQVMDEEKLADLLAENADYDDPPWSPVRLKDDSFDDRDPDRTPERQFESLAAAMDTSAGSEEVVFSSDGQQSVCTQSPMDGRKGGSKKMDEDAEDERTVKTPPKENRNLKPPPDLPPASPDLQNNKGRKDILTEEFTALLRPRRQNYRRMDMRIRVAPSASSMEVLHDQLAEWIAKIKTVDKSMVIYPWSSDEAAESDQRIMKVDDLPMSVDDKQVFFQDIRPRKFGGFVYSSVLIGFNRDIADVITDVVPKFQALKFGLYDRYLQTENKVGVGWLLWSHKDMSEARLQEELRNLTGFTIGVHYRMVSMGTTGEVPKHEQARAFHLDCDRDDKKQVKTAIRPLFHRETTNWPLGVKMRLIPLITDCYNFRSLGKLAQYRDKQIRFTDGGGCKTIKTWLFKDIDVPAPEINNITLRGILMQIKSREDPGKRLFHAVDRDYKGTEHVLLVSKNREAEARVMLPALVAYCWHGASPHRQAVNRFFTNSALQTAEGTVWDPETGAVTTRDDEDVLQDTDSEGELNDGEQVKPAGNAQIIAEIPAAVKKKRGSDTGSLEGREAVDTGSTAGSLSTMNTRGTRQPARTAAASSAASVSFSNAGTTTSSASDFSMLSSRVSSLESDLQVIRQQNSENQLLLRQLVNQAVGPGNPTVDSMAVDGTAAPSGA